MTRGLPDDDGAHTEGGVAAVLELAKRGGPVVAGPGVGKSDGAAAFVRRLVREADVAVMLDADGLNAHAGDLAALAARTAPTVLTPHEGELGRLLGIDSGAVKARRLHDGPEAAGAARAVALAQGVDTVV